MRTSLLGLVVMVAAVLAPLAAGADDTKITQKIVSKLQAHQKSGALKGFNVNVNVQDGEVWVKGEVSNESQKDLVLETTRRVPGVKIVVNNLTIDPSENAATPWSKFPRLFASKKEKSPAPEQQVSHRRKWSPQPSTPKPGIGDALRSAFTKVNPANRSEPHQTVQQRKAWAETLPSRPELAATQPGRPIRSKPAFDTPRVAPPESLNTPSYNAAAGAVSSMPSNVVQASQPNLPRQHLPQQPGYVVHRQAPVPFAMVRDVGHATAGMMAAPLAMAQAGPGGPVPAYIPGTGGGVAPARYDHPHMPQHAWPSYASYPNYGALTYPKQYSPTAWPYIGPFYPYPQVPLGWRKVTLEWDDGWWMLDFKDR